MSPGNSGGRRPDQIRLKPTRSSARHDARLVRSTSTITDFSVRVALPRQFDVLADHLGAETLAGSFWIGDEVVDAETPRQRCRRHEGFDRRERFDPLLLLSDLVALDESHVDTVDGSDRVFDRVGPVDAITEVVLDRVRRRVVIPPRADVRAGQPGGQQWKVTACQRSEVEHRHSCLVALHGDVVTAGARVRSVDLLRGSRPERLAKLELL